MALFQYGAIKIPAGYKAKLRLREIELDKVNEAARIAVARSDEYDKLASDQLGINSLMYSMAVRLNEKHGIGLTLPPRPDSRDSFADIQTDARVTAYSLIALAHLLSITVDEYEASADAAGENVPAQTYDRLDPGSEHISVNDITGHTVSITDLFGTLDSQSDTYDDHKAQPEGSSSVAVPVSNLQVMTLSSPSTVSGRVLPTIR